MWIRAHIKSTNASPHQGASPTSADVSKPSAEESRGVEYYAGLVKSNLRQDNKATSTGALFPQKLVFGGLELALLPHSAKDGLKCCSQ